MPRPLSAVRDFLNSAIQGFQSIFNGEDPDKDMRLIFAGIDNEYDDGTIEFGFYEGVYDVSPFAFVLFSGFVWHPATVGQASTVRNLAKTQEPEVAEELKNMKVGQEFQLLREESVGGLVTYASRLKVNDTVHKVPENKPPAFSL